MSTFQNSSGTAAEVAEGTSVSLPQAQQTINTVEDQTADNDSHLGIDQDDHSSAHSSASLPSPTGLAPHVPVGPIPHGSSYLLESMDSVDAFYAILDAQHDHAPWVHDQRGRARRGHRRRKVSDSVRKLWLRAKGIVQDGSGFVKRIFRQLKAPRSGPQPQAN